MIDNVLVGWRVSSHLASALVGDLGRLLGQVRFEGRFLDFPLVIVSRARLGGWCLHTVDPQRLEVVLDGKVITRMHVENA